jgi:hypothetical protein
VCYGESFLMGSEARGSVLNGLFGQNWKGRDSP